MKDDIRKQINDIIEGEIQNGINDYIERKGRGFDGQLTADIDQDEVDKLIEKIATAEEKLQVLKEFE